MDRDCCGCELTVKWVKQLTKQKTLGAKADRSIDLSSIPPSAPEDNVRSRRRYVD